MNHVSLRQSSGGSTAFSWNCSSRCVLVNDPAFSADPLRAGRRFLSAIFSGIKFAALDFRRILPECGCFRLNKVADHKPFQVGQRGPLQPSVRCPHGGILSHHKETFQFAIGHVEPIAVFRMVAGYARQEVEAKFVFGSCGLSVPGLEQADGILIKVVPPACCGRVLLQIHFQVFESSSKNGMGR